MAKQVIKTGSIETAYGTPVSPALELVYEFEQLADNLEVPADEVPTAKEILQLVNAKRNATARSKATTECLAKAGYEKPKTDLSLPEVQFKGMVRILMAAGKSQVDAEQMAKATLGQ